MPDTTRTERSLELGAAPKARALVDVVGGISQPAHLLAALAQYPAAASLLAQERELIARLNRVPASERANVRNALADIWQQMQSEPALADYLELRLGAALDPQDVQTMLTDDLAAARPASVWIGSLWMIGCSCSRCDRGNRRSVRR